MGFIRLKRLDTGLTSAFNCHNFSIRVASSCFNPKVKHMINVNKNNEYHKWIILSDNLFHKGLRPLVTMSTADIPVLHSIEVVHFHCES